MGTSHLPVGNVTFLMTDVEGSTKLHGERPDVALAALRIHDKIGAQTIAANNGLLIKSKGEGDSLFAVFENAADAIRGVLDFQMMLETAPWPEHGRLRVRAAIHTGEAELDDGDYRGVTVNRCARLRGICHGGQVIISTATKELVENELPELVTLRDLGYHRLKDLLQPENVFQLDHPDLQLEFPALTSLGNRPNNLPQQLTSFVGREKEIAEVTALVKASRMVTLLGGGGSGKTRLSLQIGGEVLDHFSAGVFFVELASIFETELIAHAISAAIKVREEPGVPMLATITRWLQDKNVLLIFDNCEQIADGLAETINQLLKDCEKLSVMSTSRQALRVKGECEFRVPSLSVPDSRNVQSVTDIESAEAVKLLLERTATKAPNFKLTDANAAAVARLCSQLEGIPLCIELVAPKLKLYSPDQLVTKLTDVFRVLTSSAVGDDPRHQTIEATIDWSYQLLSDDERAVFRWISVFPAGCSIEAADFVCSKGLTCDVVESISQLYDKSMLSLEPMHDGSMRQRQLATVRAYGNSKLRQEGEIAAANNAMVDWCLQSANEVTGSNDKDVLDEHNSNHYNYRAAIEWCLQNPELAVQSLLFTIGIHRYWLRRGHFREGMAWLQMALNAANTEAPAEMRADGLNILGVFAWYQGQLDVAKRSIDESAALWRVVGNQAKLAAALNNSALLSVQEGDIESASEYLSQAVAIYESMADSRHLADGLANLGNLEIERKDFTKAIAYLQRSLTLKRQLGDLWGVAMVLGSLAQAHMFERDIKSTVPKMKECLRMVRNSNDEHLASSSLLEAAYLGVLQGQIELAARLSGASDAAVERLGIELNVSHAKLRDLVVAAINESPGGAYSERSNAGRTLPYENALDEAIAFVENPDFALNLN